MRQLDLTHFLTGGETLPDDGVQDAKPLLQRALDEVAATVPTLGPATIRIPPGRYRIDDSVRYKTGYHVGFAGAGRADTVIAPTGTAVFGFMDFSYDMNTYLDDLAFSDFTVDCSAQDGPRNQVGIKGISLRFMRRGSFTNIRIINSWATSFGCDFLQNVTFTNCIAEGSGRGVDGRSSFGAGFGIGVGNFARESVSFVNCVAERSRSSGFFVERLIETRDPVEDSRGFSIIGCTSADGWNGIHDFGAHGLLVADSHLINNENAGIHIEGGTVSARHGGKDGRVSGSVLNGNGAGVSIGHAATGAYAFDDNEIVANTIGVQAGTDARVGPGWRWRGNRIEQNTNGGVILDDSLLVRPEWRQNTIRENGPVGIRVGSDTVAPIITDNVITGHTGPGIHLAGADTTCTTPIIRHNLVVENAGWLVNDKRTEDDWQITDNRTSPPVTAVRNLAVNPSFEQGVAHATALQRFDNPVQSSEGGAKAGASFARFVVNQAGSATARAARVTAPISGPFTLSAWVRAPRTTMIRPIGVVRWNGNTSTRNHHQGGVKPTGDWQLVSVTVPAPPDGSQLDLNIALDVTVVGDTLDVDGVMIVQGTTVWPYFDGDSPGAEWEGTPHDSVSALTVT